MSTDYSEDALVEQPTIAMFCQLGYKTANCFYEKVGSTGSTLGRETTEQVILFTRLRSALQRLNPDLDSTAIDLAVDELARDRNAMSPAQANREVYKLLKDGVKVAFQNEDGEETDETVRVIDWANSENNDFFLASQFWISSPNGIYKRRVDLIGFVNGLPLVFIELKKSHGKIEHAYKHNLKDYRDTIPSSGVHNSEKRPRRTSPSLHPRALPTKVRQRVPTRLRQLPGGREEHLQNSMTEQRHVIWF